MKQVSKLIVSLVPGLTNAYNTMPLTSDTSSATGTTYTRWGKVSCPSDNGTELLYAGKAGGAKYSTRGGGVEKLCLPDNPDYLPGTTGFARNALIYGAEYEFYSGSGPVTNVYNHIAPCAVCYVPNRATAVMIPAKTECPSSWTREYYGYLTSERDAYHRSSFTCVDVNPEFVPGTSVNTEGALFYYTSSTCIGLNCPPYENNRILSCVVCTK